MLSGHDLSPTSRTYVLPHSFPVFVEVGRSGTFRLHVLQMLDLGPRPVFVCIKEKDPCTLPSRLCSSSHV